MSTTAQPISVGAWYRRGWQAFRSNPGTLIGGVLIAFAINAAVSLVGTPASGRLILMLILSLLVGPSLWVGWAYLCLRVVRQEESGALTVFSGFRHWGPSIGGAVVYGFILIGGSILLVVPGVIWALRYCMWPFAVGERNLGVTNALRFSARITKGHKGRLFGAGLIAALLCLLLYLVLALLLVFGVVPRSFIGDPRLVAALLRDLSMLPAMVIIGPWLGAAFAVAYDDLVAAAGAAATTTEPTPPPPPT